MPGFFIKINQDCIGKDSFQEKSAYNGPSPNSETARSYRYLLEVLEPLGSQSSGLLLYLNKASRPSVEFDEIPIYHGQDTIYRPGKTKFGSVEFSFYEILSGDKKQQDLAAKLIYEWWAKTMLDVNSSRFNPVSSYYKDAQLSMLDGVGQSIWRYNLYDCWPQKIAPSELGYDDNSISNISVTLRYSKCVEDNL